MLIELLFVWIGVTVILVGMLIYRGRITMDEEDQIFLDSAEQHLADHQAQIVAKAEKITRPIHLFGWLSGVLGLILVVLAVKDALGHF